MNQIRGDDNQIEIYDLLKKHGTGKPWEAWKSMVHPKGRRWEKEVLPWWSEDAQGEVQKEVSEDRKTSSQVLLSSGFLSTDL